MTGSDLAKAAGRRPPARHIRLRNSMAALIGIVLLFAPALLPASATAVAAAEPVTSGIVRHGRLLAHLRDADGQWIQGNLLARGMERVYTIPNNRARAAELLSREQKARAARRGIWALPF